jgi:hypothetical protein
VAAPGLTRSPRSLPVLARSSFTAASVGTRPSRGPADAPGVVAAVTRRAGRRGRAVA